MNLSITRRAPYAPPVEFVERKGSGHPDTICDALADDLARRLAMEYVAQTGAVRPFNVDKAILAAGAVDVAFGGGRHIKPSRVVLVGKADFGHGWQPDIEALEKEFHGVLMEILPDADPDAFTLEIWLNQSSADLANVVSRQSETVPLSNDTSFAAVSMPRSPLEDAVYSIEHHLNSTLYRREVPIGRDIKVMGARVGDDATLTVAVPVLATKVANRAEYDEVIDAVRDEVTDETRRILGDNVDVRVNGADADDSPYLTLSGTSAEAGDDGQVGRGNRFGGLITPYRPMSLEAAAGKNPAAHVGKTYHAVAYDISQRIMAETNATEATIRLLSSIGSPVTEPQATHVEIVGEADEDHLATIAKESLDDWQGVRDRLVAGEYELY